MTTMPSGTALFVPRSVVSGRLLGSRCLARARCVTGYSRDMPQLAPGESAPRFALPDQDGKTVSSESLKGKPAVVYFYPADDTPGGTTEACQLNDNLQQLQQTGGPAL